MGRRKPGRNKRVRPDATALMKMAAAYRCGHCRSEVGTGHDAATGLDTVQVTHDNRCPVLLGTLSDVPDTLRAAEAVGALVVADAATGRVVALCPPGAVNPD
jgi:hypothetical protein